LAQGSGSRVQASGYRPKKSILDIEFKVDAGVEVLDIEFKVDSGVEVLGI